MEVLHDLELLGRMPGRQRDSGSGREANHRQLREILHAAPEVTRPFVRRGARIVVDRRKRQFVQPAGDATLAVQETRRLARTHRDAEHTLCAQRHRAGQRGDVAVVGHFERHAPFLAQVHEQGLDLPRELLGRHPAKERGDHHVVAHVNARRAAADGIHAREMSRFKPWLIF